MAKVTCKCGHTWSNREDYLKQGRNHHKECKLSKKTTAVPAETGAVPQVKMRVLFEEIDVRSDYTEALNNCVYLEVPRVIEIKIYPHKARR